MESRIFMEAIPLRRNRKVNQRGVVPFQRPVEISECGVEVPDRT